jgi:hypothetical protein
MEPDFTVYNQESTPINQANVAPIKQGTEHAEQIHTIDWWIAGYMRFEHG